MLPGITPVGGSKPPATAGIDADTVSLLGFDDALHNTAMPSGMTTKDRINPSRVWTSQGNAGGQKFWNGYFSGGSCLYSDGSGVHGPASDPQYYFAGDFTIDLWVVSNGTSGGFSGTLLTKPNAGNFSPYQIYQNAAQWLFYSSSNGTSWDIANGQLISGANGGDWTHIAVQRKGNTYTLYSNGTLVTTFTSSLTPMNTSDAPQIGHSNTINSWGGWIDEVRFSRVARYPAGTFPRPDCPYAGIVNGQNDEYTKVLCKMDGNGAAFIDSARGKNFGTRWTYPPLPQGAPVQMAGYVNAAGFGASAYCAAVTDGVNIGGTPLYSNDWSIGYRGSFTIDFWWHRTTNTAGNVFSIRDNSGQVAPFSIYDSGSGALVIYASGNDSAWNFLGGNSIGTVPISTWTHIAIVMDRLDGNNTCKAYINGTQTFTTPWSGNYSGMVKALRVGSLADGTGAPGYYDEVRFSNCARWRANFTRPAAPYQPNIPEDATKVLLHFDGDFYDRSSSPHPFTAVGSPTTAGGTGLFGAGNSVLLNGAKYLTTPQAADLNLGPNWTVEWWEYRIAAVNNAAAIVFNGSVGSGLPALLCGYETTGGAIQFFSSFDGNGWNIANMPMGNAVYGNWCHRAVSRQGPIWYAHQDGVLQPSAMSLSGTPNPNNGMQIGLYYGPTYFNGYIEEVRVSTVARYPYANFTPSPLYTRSPQTPFYPP